MSLMKYKTKINLYSSYFDFNDNITAKAILSIFQDVASIHAEELGIGYLPMLDKNLYWVLSRIKFDILKKPSAYQTVVVETWPHEKGKVDFDRDMKISSEDGEVLIIATSKWCVIDTKTRMLQRTENVNYNGEYCLDINYSERFGKIILPNEELTPIYVHTVKFSDLDHNEHMNNTNYADLVLNSVTNKYFSHFEINYTNECRLDDQISISSIKNQTEEYVVGTCNNKTAFVAYIK